MKSPTRAHVGNEAYDQRPAKDRHINSLTVACPDCLAGEGERCVGYLHKVRRRLAIRHLWESGQMGQAATLPVPSGRKLQGVRRSLGLSGRALSEQLGLPAHAIRNVESGRVPTGDAATAIAEWFARVTGAPSP